MQKKGFTLVEILIVIFVISMGLILIIRGMSETHRYISETAQKTIALNLAKEGIEAVYNLRNSNWRKWSDKKDECWLMADTTNNAKDCKTSDWVKQGIHYLITTQSWTTLSYVGETNQSIDQLSEQYLNTRLTNLQRTHPSIKGKSRHQLEASKDTGLSYYFLHYFPWTGWVDFKTYYNILNDTQRAKEEYSSGIYARAIYLDTPYDKQNGTKLPKSNDLKWICTDTKCQDSSAKEVRFCSVVRYISPHQWYVKICSIMTNFEQ